MLQVLRIRDFRLLWGGGLVSALGSWLLTIAVPAHILLVTGSLRSTCRCWYWARSPGSAPTGGTGGA
jgi:hypothetical protein